MAYENGKTYWFISHSGTGRALSVYGNSQVSQNRNVILWDKQSVNDQKWLVSIYNGFGRIRSALDNSYALNIWTGGNNPNNCDIHTWADNQNDSMVDFLTVSASENLYKIKLLNYNLLMTATGSANGNDVRWQAPNGASNQIWKLVDVSGGGSGGGGSTSDKTIEMNVNLNQKFNGYEQAIKDYGCALCCGVDIASFKENKTYTINDFEGHFSRGTNQQGKRYVSYGWTCPGSTTFKPVESLAALSETATIAKIRGLVAQNIPVACHAVGATQSNGETRQHWFIAYSITANGGNTWATSGISVLDPYNNDASSYNGRRVSISDAMASSNTTLGIDAIRIPY